MSPFRLAPVIAIATATVVAGTCLALPAHADSPVQVTFQPDTHWVQEVATLGRSNDNNEYSVSVQNGKILQINLLTRDPNVFFKVKNETQDKQLVDTYKTGATTWSTPPATATANYLIRVYVDPYSIQPGEKAKYALQIGQYGQSDMQPATTPVTFADNNPWAQEEGTLDAQGTAEDYTVVVAAGQTLAVNFASNNPKVHFKVLANGQTLVDSANTNANSWSTPVDAATNYTIRVYADPAALPPGSRAGYTLQVGQYAQRNAQPATAGTAATPAAGGSTQD
jgi:hypothetical protein